MPNGMGEVPPNDVLPDGRATRNRPLSNHPILVLGNANASELHADDRDGVHLVQHYRERAVVMQDRDPARLADLAARQTLNAVANLRYVVHSLSCREMSCGSVFRIRGRISERPPRWTPYSNGP